MKHLHTLRTWLTTGPTKYIVGVIVIVLALIVLVQIRASASKDSEYEAYIVKRGDISETIINSGNVSISANASVYSQTNGIVEAVYVKNGDVVSEGQELVKIRSTATDSERSAALAAYQSALSTYNSSKSSKIANQSLLEAGRKTVIDASVALEQMTNRRNVSQPNPLTNKPYTQDEIESIKSSYTSAKKSFEVLEKKYLDSDGGIAASGSDMAAKSFAYQATVNGLVKAPIAGTVANLTIEPGDAVLASSGVGMSSPADRPLLRIGTLEAMSIKVALNEIDIAKVREGQNATVVFDAFPDKMLQATVSRVDSIGTNTNAVVTYDVYITTTDTDPRVRSGMTATVTITTDPKKDVLIVPNIGLSKEKNDIIIRKKNGTSTTSQKVTVGIKNSINSEVISGVADGDTILVPKSK